MMVDRLGVHPSYSKIDALAQLSPATSVEHAGSLLGMTDHSRNFVTDYSTGVAPISDLLGD